MAQNGLSAWTTVCGIPVTCKPEVSLSLGPVVGEVTSTSAIIMLEVGNESSLPTEVTCHIHRKVGTGLVQEQMITFPDKAPKVFVFGEGSALEPNTEYIAVFSGICREDATQTFAMFKTKPEEIKSFKIIALSCDRPDRMLPGQKNPWHELAGKSYEADEDDKREPAEGLPPDDLVRQRRGKRLHHPEERRRRAGLSSCLPPVWYGGVQTVPTDSLGPRLCQHARSRQTLPGVPQSHLWTSQHLHD